jgi:hypothetical protein
MFLPLATLQLLSHEKRGDLRLRAVSQPVFRLFGAGKLKAQDYGLCAGRHLEGYNANSLLPWSNTLSWVVPTAFSILSLNQLPCSCGGLENVPARIDCGIQMLFDRACPGGGWNAGNGVVYGTALAPHPDDTAIALLAVREREQNPVVQGSVEYLERVAPTLTAPWSLAWAILALAAYGQPIASLSNSLAALPDLSGIEDTSTLALVCLALDYTRALSAFGVAQ